MITGDVQSIVVLLKSMAEVELTVAKFYRECAQVINEDKDFWLDLVKEEKNHAKSLVKMYKIISKKQERFEKGRNFNVAAIKTFISRIEDNILRLKKGELLKKNVFYMARDIEQALLEDKISEIVRTDDVEYQTLAKNIHMQTKYHKNKINKKIKELENLGK